MPNPWALSKFFRAAPAVLLSSGGWRIVLWGFALAAAIRDGCLLYRHRIAVGLDGYYYVVQVWHILETGRPYYASHSLAFCYLAAGLSSLFGHPVVVIKALCLALQLLFSVAIFYVMRSLTGRAEFGFFAAILSQISVLHLYFLSEYCSNLLALVLLAWALVVLLDCVMVPRLGARLRIAAVLGLVALALLAHRSAGPLILLIAAGYAAVWALLSTSTWSYAGGLLTIVAWLSPAALSRLPVGYLPVWALGSFQPYPKWPVTSFEFPETLLLLILSPWVLGLIASKGDRIPAVPARVLGTAAWIGMVVLLNPFLNFRLGPSNLAGRLALLSYIFLAILAPGLVWLLITLKSAWVPVGVICCVGFAALFPFGRWPGGLKEQSLVRCEDLIAGLKRHQVELADVSLILAKPGDQFVVTATLNIPSQWTLPSDFRSDSTFWLLDDFPNRWLTSRDFVLLDQRDSSTVLAPLSEVTVLMANRSGSRVDSLLRANLHLQVAYGYAPEATDSNQREPR